MSLFNFKKKEKRKSRSALIMELEFYKDQLLKEQKRCDEIRGEKASAEFETKRLTTENKGLAEEIEKLKQENLAKLNIITDERRKYRKTIDQMQKRIDKLEGELKTKKGGNSKEDNDLPFDKKQH